MANTTAREVFDFFESSFRDKVIIPEELEVVWLKRAIGRYSTELELLEFDELIREFNCELDPYVIDTLAMYMRQFYQEREVSKVNKRVSIVTKDLSIDGNGNAKSAAKNELDYFADKSDVMTDNQKPTAYA